MSRIAILLVSLILWGCSPEENTLPILGEKKIDPITGKTVHYQAPAFQLVNQLDQTVSEQDFAGKIQVVDFFFTSCPTICPQMTTHLKLVDEAFTAEDAVALISYSIDPQHDTPERLRHYTEQRAIDTEKWSFLTGDRAQIFAIAKDYKVRAFDDSYAGAAQNLIHDGIFVLVDGNRHIRGYYDGLDRTDTYRLIDDITRLLQE